MGGDWCRSTTATPHEKTHIQYTQTSTFSTGNDPNTLSKPTPKRHRVDILLGWLPKQETLKSLNVTCWKRRGWVRDFVSESGRRRRSCIILPVLHRTRTNYKSIPITQHVLHVHSYYYMCFWRNKNSGRILDTSSKLSMQVGLDCLFLTGYTTPLIRSSLSSASPYVFCLRTHASRAVLQQNRVRSLYYWSLLLLLSTSWRLPRLIGVQVTSKKWHNQ